MSPVLMRRSKALPRRKRAQPRHTLRQARHPYGESADERLDLFWPAEATGAPRPLHIFIHGGYWRAFSRQDYAFVADSIVAAGAVVVMIGYGLMPTIRMAELIRQVRSAGTWTARNVEAFGGDPARISASGHSAGAHLASFLATDLAGEDTPPVSSLLLVSGIYDVRPIRDSLLQAELALSEAETRRWSPIDHRLKPGTSVTIAVGADETAPFLAQAEAYGGHLARQGIETRNVVLRGEDHMTVVRRLGQAGTAAAGLLAAAIDRTASPPSASGSD
jgi:arylformamidase